MNASTRSLAARVEGALRHHAKYCGMELLADPDYDKAGVLKETSNCVTFALRGDHGRIWTVSVADPDDGVEDP